MTYPKSECFCKFSTCATTIQSVCNLYLRLDSSNSENTAYLPQVSCHLPLLHLLLGKLLSPSPYPMQTWFKCVSKARHHTLNLVSKFTSMWISWLDDSFNFCFCCAVVSQPYVTETHNTYVIKGNSALFKCEIPSFVADFVSAEGWVDGDGQEFFAQSGHGNFRRPAHTLVAVKRTPNNCASFMNLFCPG